MNLILGIDFGGTKTAVGVYAEDGQEFARNHSLNPKTENAEILWDSVAEIIQKVSAPYLDEITACGIAAAGTTSNNRELISPPNLLAWKDFPLKKRISDLINKPVYFENDANALALGEGFLGAAKGETNYMSMVVSTGIGGGIVVDGRLLHGHDGNAGEIGHTIIDINGPSCGFGCQGCVEGIASGPALEKKFGIKPENATLEMKQFCADSVAQMIVNVVTITDVHLITIGGSVALGFGDEFFSRCQETYLKLAMPPSVKDVKIVPSTLGHDGGLISAARVAILGEQGLL